MYDYHVVFGAVGVVFGLTGFWFYVRSIFRGETKPHLFTWLTFVLLDITVFFAQVLHGAGPGAWAVLLSVVECSVITLLAVRWGEKHITKVDWASLIIALAGIALWALTSDALVAVVIACGVNVFGYVPTFRKAYIRPHQESITIWAFDIFRFGLSLIALEAFTPTTALFPAAVALGNATLVVMVLLRRRQLGRVSQL